MKDREAIGFLHRPRNDVEGSSLVDHPPGSRSKHNLMERGIPMANPSAPAPQRPLAFGRYMASEALLGLLGHTESCLALIRAGPITSCDCRTSHMEDPAIAVEVTRHYVRAAVATGTPIPTVILKLLTCHVMDADPACTELADWLEAAGLLDLPRQANSHQGADHS
ncbi:hypothetical protein EN962_27645 [Mesorhizobium sp. M7A.F.Ca.CA.001.09.2.1]|uniref:DUF742 domain-containing protein n=1 Tax=Mesorhizobium ciceri TaxID=39645 RepID=A0AB38T6T6_9HYPH|nr:MULTISPECIES: hypothetical protein [Mesorhizobium]RUY52678.1 hypothetical protein EN981_10550 [Mesorhizobium sp. M7A.F.Ca.CA.001.13.2.1]MDF3217936.1 hypothetical protein [Mesorhizobium ciceri]RUY64342.1 hypothetical protein EN980_25635 [Mesorhizobium sp. M7A.F.Ca.CA.001.13.1.1]RUY73488.1 hypothetical protein EN962_27645 [Mesorhizobium sp. M7A.F.Ca.CA.001.09.2.1]RUY74158.1 hypothetical protein EN965_02155 [Mesorhizobium sp. M7A.F.Ca.CA.001.05.1.1]